MTKNKIKTELLAPVGNFEKLEIAVNYGADAVYLSTKEFSLRNFSGNFTLPELKEALAFARQHQVKVYVACNIYARNTEIKAVSSYLSALKELAPDGLIVSDPGIIMMAVKTVPEIPLHLSTQANTTNIQTVKFWEDIGIKRVNVARELPLDEIREISDSTTAEIEAFVHGAMCISYSGRCLLSSFLTKRDSNRGMCSHPCRWQYAVVEELRPGEYMPVCQDDRGTYIFNSKDLCMIEHIPEMIAAGIRALKIEGRMKTINYLASTVKVYREALDAYYADPASYTVEKQWIEELASVSHRGYCTGFYFNDPDEIAANMDNIKPLQGHMFIGKVLAQAGPSKVTIHVRNKIFQHDTIEVLSKRGPLSMDTILEIEDQDGNIIPFAQPGSIVSIRVKKHYDTHDLIRRAGDLP